MPHNKMPQDKMCLKKINGMDLLQIGDILIFRYKDDMWLKWGHAGIYLGPKIIGGATNLALVYHIKRDYGKPSIDLYEFTSGNDELSVLRYTGEKDFPAKVEAQMPDILRQTRHYTYSFLASVLVLLLPCFLDLEVNPRFGLICSSLVVLVYRKLLPGRFPLSPGCSPANLRRLVDLPDWTRFTIKNIDKTMILKDVPYDG